ncbi:MAG: alpha/beta hydrolase [Promethearchaeota archaeon]
MSPFILSKKRIILICIFSTIFIIGTIFIFITPFSVKSTYGLTTTTTDGVTIAFNVFEPQNGGINKPAFIIGHGIMANKEMLKDYAIELATTGFVAIPFDFRGHGQSSAGDPDGMFRDIIAIKEYLNTRGDVNMNSLGYIGYSMGGLGQGLINNDTDFICFIGVGTGLYNSTKLRLGNSTNPLDILMIQALFDEAVELDGLKMNLATRINVPSANDVNVNKIYGSFNEGNATMIYLDDDSNHLKVAWDVDFIRLARDWAINSFDINVIDENFYANTRAIILLIQVIGGMGFFFIIIEPFSKLIVQSKKERKRGVDIDSYKIESTSLTVKNLSIKAFVYSLVFGIPGILIFIPLLLILPLAIAGFALALLFGQTFGFIVLLWRIGKKVNTSLIEMITNVFKGTTRFLKHLALGTILAAILYIIAYLSVGLNYFALLPSINKFWILPIYFVILFFINIIYSLLMQVIIQNKYLDSLQNTLKIFIIGLILPSSYYFIYLLILGFILRSFFFLGIFFPIALILFMVNSSTSIMVYKKSGNIIAGAVINAILVAFIIVTISPSFVGLAFFL